MTIGLEQSQRQAAAVVMRVLDGESLAQALQAAPADGPARSLVRELAYGTLRHHGTLAALVGVLAAKPLAHRDVATIVEVALYQLMHARTPPFAVVDQAVRAVEAAGRPAAKPLVNALLRRFLRERDALVAQVNRDPVARWSYPAWWIARIRADHPRDWQSILAAGNARPPLTLRVNLRRTPRDALLATFVEAGIDATPVPPDGIVVTTPTAVTALPGFDAGLFSVQDSGAQWAAHLLAARDGMRVLDACAAPGGKTAHILERADVDLLALDRDAQRLARVDENLARLGLASKRVRVAAADARAPAGWWDGKPFERILADVPCSASGVVRRHPDGKWLRRASDIDAFAREQDAVLGSLWPLVAPGGRLLYATCSLFRAENAARVDAFLAAHPDALRGTLNLPAGVAGADGQLLPAGDGAPHNQDGFFYALIDKA
ncbi:MAG: 16S rRNA (cytosine(967)-C(5))-methyltransferase RsmB [Proteobacteria bacterium]|nr:16S rRNA (cytosine(967)-C(5))-methyltransferase RsmB [Pseudomonadota bacterium]